MGHSCGRGLARGRGAVELLAREDHDRADAGGVVDRAAIAAGLRLHQIGRQEVVACSPMLPSSSWNRLWRQRLAMCGRWAPRLHTTTIYRFLYFKRHVLAAHGLFLSVVPAIWTDLTNLDHCGTWHLATGMVIAAEIPVSGR